MGNVLYHVPVLLKESLDLLFKDLQSRASKVYIDATFGGGGYTNEILTRTGENVKVLAIDRDADVKLYAREVLDKFRERIILKCGNFSDIKRLTDMIFKEGAKNKVSGIVADLGLSTYQLDYKEGFSYQKDTELDMRADGKESKGITAKDILNKFSEKELLEIFRNYGELKYYRQITREILMQRKKKLFATTFDLVNLFSSKIPRRYLNKDLSKIFQALRITVNNELENLKSFLSASEELLENSGKLVVVSYHSLEDRIVKNFFKLSSVLKVLTKKPITATIDEIENNPRARSAKLRAAERI